MSNISRQYGVHEIPGTEEEAPNRARQVSAGFEGQMRDYVGAIWLKMGELERKVVSLEEWREELTYKSTRLASPGVARPASGEKSDGPHPATGEGGRPPPKPWLAAGVSKATWYRRQKGGA
jgi:hypothetical protein